MKKKNFLHEYSTTIAIIVAIVITAALNFANLIPSEQVLNYLLCADAGLVVGILFSAMKNADAFQELAERNERAISALEERMDPQISRKVSRREHYELLNDAATNAKSKIMIMTIDAALHTKNKRSIPERGIYYENLNAIAREKRDIIIKRIYGLPSDPKARADRIKWIREDLEAVKDCPNYHMYIFDWKKFKSIPAPLSLQIVDDTFVGLVNMQHAASGVAGDGEDLCIKDRNIVQHLQIYYEAIREKCDCLKDGESVNETLLR